MAQKSFLDFEILHYKRNLSNSTTGLNGGSFIHVSCENERRTKTYFHQIITIGAMTQFSMFPLNFIRSLVTPRCS